MPILRLEGTWCTNTVAHGSDLLRHWVASVEATELAVDLSEIDFCDGRAISMLLELRLIAARRGCLLRLCRPNHCVTRLFTICDLDNLLEDDFPIVQASRHHQDLRRNVR